MRILLQETFNRVLREFDEEDVVLIYSESFARTE